MKYIPKFQKGGPQLHTPSSFIKYAIGYNQLEDQKKNPQNYLGLKDPNFIPQSGAIEQDFTPEMITGALLLPVTPVIKGIGKVGNFVVDALNPLSGMSNRKETLREFNKNFKQIIDPNYQKNAKKALKEGNVWLENWFNNPKVLEKLIDLSKISKKGIYNNWDGMLSRIKNNEYKTKFESKAEQIYDFIKGKPSLFKENNGQSGPGIFSNKIRTNYVSKYPEHYWDKLGLKNWQSKYIRSVTVHEGTHGVVDGHTLVEEMEEMMDNVFDITKAKDMSINELNNFTKPTEVYSMIMQTREYYNIKPEEIVSEDFASRIIKEGLEKTDTPVDYRFYQIIKDPKSLAKLLNTLPAMVSMGIGLNQVQKKQTGGKLKNNLPKDYQQFLDYSKTAPENRQPEPGWEYGNPDQYDHYGMWDALGKPKDFKEALKKNPDWKPDKLDGMYHGFSTNPNTGIWLKSHTPGTKKVGNTSWMENLGFQLSGDKNWNSNRFNLVYDPEIKRMRYIEKNQKGGKVSSNLSPRQQAYNDTNIEPHSFDKDGYRYDYQNYNLSGTNNGKWQWMKKKLIPNKEYERKNEAYTDSIFSAQYTEALKYAAENSFTQEQFEEAERNAADNGMTGMTTDIKPVNYEKITIGSKDYNIPIYNRPKLVIPDKFAPDKGVFKKSYDWTNNQLSGLGNVPFLKHVEQWTKNKWEEWVGAHDKDYQRMTTDQREEMRQKIHNEQLALYKTQLSTQYKPNINSNNIKPVVNNNSVVEQSVYNPSEYIIERVQPKQVSIPSEQASNKTMRRVPNGWRQPLPGYGGMEVEFNQRGEPMYIYDKNNNRQEYGDGVPRFKFKEKISNNFIASKQKGGIIKDLEQSEKYDCGASALRAVLLGFGEKVTEKQLIKETHSNNKIGTKISEIVRVVKDYGYNAVSKENCTIKDIELEIGKGNRIILLQNGVDSTKKNTNYSGVEDGHYITVKSIENKKITFEDPATKGIESMTYSDLEKRWHGLRDDNKTIVNGQMIIISPKKKLQNGGIINKEIEFDEFGFPIKT